eukprot:252390-Amorphochlora_amoeboformis.AAC.1
MLNNLILTRRVRSRRKTTKRKAERNYPSITLNPNPRGTSLQRRAGCRRAGRLLGGIPGISRLSGVPET